MSTLSKLKLIEAQKPNALPVIVIRRNKLSDKLWEQLQLARSQKSGETFAPLRRKSFRNAETGERTSIETPKRVRPWWFTENSGKLCFSVRYGAKVLDIAKGKNAVEVANLDDLVKFNDSANNIISEIII